MTRDNKKPLYRDMTLIFPFLLGMVSLLGIGLVLMPVWSPSQNEQAVPLPTETSFKYLFLGTETPLATSIPLTPPGEGDTAPFSAMVGQDETPSGDSSASNPANPVDVEQAEKITTPGVSSRCSPASQEHLDAIWQVIQYADPDNELESGWVVESNQVPNLTFIAAKVHGPQVEAGTTLPGIWGVFFYSSGDFDIYSINETAQEFSYTATGEDFDPVISMEMDGAQDAYDCALSGP